MIIVVADPDGFYGPFERWESIKPAQRKKLQEKHNEDFWQLELERPAGEPSMSAAEWQAKDDAWVVIDRWRAVGPFANKAAAAAWMKKHPLPRGILGLLQPEPPKRRQRDQAGAAREWAALVFQDTKNMTTTNDDREPLVYGPHRELYDLIETLEAALEQPRKRSAAIEEAITYLCKLHGLLFVLTDQMNDAARKASEEQPEIPG